MAGSTANHVFESPDDGTEYAAIEYVGTGADDEDGDVREGTYFRRSAWLRSCWYNKRVRRFFAESTGAVDREVADEGTV